MSSYDNPNFLTIRYQYPVGAAGNQGSISCPSVTTAYVGSTLKVATKCAILGVTFMIQSGAESAVGTNSISVSRIVAGSSPQVWKTHTLTTSLGASMLGDVIDISLASALTVNSIGDSVVLEGNAASAHKLVVIKNIIWRYRVLHGDHPTVLG